MQTERQQKLEALAAIIALHPQTPDKFKEHARAARSPLSSIPFNRNYGVDYQSELSLVAACRVLWAAIQGHATSEISNTEFLTRVAKVEPSLVQAWRPQAPEPLPQPWRNPVTGEALRNPWEEPQDKAEQTLLVNRDSKLARFFMEMARHPYGFVAKMRADEARRQAFARVEYNGGIHKSSPLVSGDDPAIANFIATHDETTVEVFRNECAPVRCFWSPKFLEGGPNRQRLSDAAVADPEIGLLLITATKAEAELADAMAGK